MSEHNGDRDKKPNQNPSGRLVYSPTGGGPLVPGNPGNRGGKPGRSGRPPSVIREALRQSFDKRRRILDRIADGKLPDTTLADRLRAMDLIGKYGLVEPPAGMIHVSVVSENLRRTLDLLRGRLPRELADEIIAALRDIWKGAGR